MNGIRVLVLSLLLAQPATAFQDAERDFGWQIRDGAVEYIVQVSPEEARDMQQNNMENASDLPEELVGRVSRIVVRIGTSPLPREPSLEAIKRDFPRLHTQSDLSAALGPGSFSNLESESVRTIQQDQIASPQGSSGRYPIPSAATPLPSGNLIDQAARAGGSGSDLPPLPSNSYGATSRGSASGPSSSDLGSKFLGGAGGSSLPGTSNSNDPPSAADRASSTNNGLADDGRSGSKYEDAITSDDGSRTSSTANGSSYADRSRDRSAAVDASRRPSSDWSRSTDDTGYGQPNRSRIGGNYASDRGYAGDTASGRDGRATQIPGRSLADRLPFRDSGSATGRGRPSTTGGYAGGNYASEGRFNRGYADGSYGGQQYGGYAHENSGGYDDATSGRRPGYGGEDHRNRADGKNNYRLAANDNVPSTSGGKRDSRERSQAEKSTGKALAKSEDDSSPSDTASGDNGSTSNGSGERNTASNSSFLQVFFVLSLVVNFYLGHLLRKLLNRYRALLTSVRGQTA